MGKNGEKEIADRKCNWREGNQKTTAWLITVLAAKSFD